jgi:glycosyltransferase involved in cell wall biosynthesis
VRGLRLPGEKLLRALEWLGKPLDWRHIGSRRILNDVGLDDFDVVHAHNLHGGWISIGAVRRLARRVPLVWTLHDEWAVTGGLSYDVSRVMEPRAVDRRFVSKEPLHSGHPVASQRRRFLEPLLPEPAAVICPSRWLAGLARTAARFRDLPVEHVPYGIVLLDRPESALERREARKAFGIPPEERVVLLAAADLSSPYKGAPLAVETLARVRTPRTRLLVLSRSADQVAAAVPMPVLAPGFVGDEGTLAAAYRAADVTLIPSIADNLPYVGLESLSCGTPLAAFRVGGLEEMVGREERGLLAEPFDTVQLARHVERLLEDAELAVRLGAAGRIWAAGCCSMQGYLSATLRVYEEARSSWPERRGCAATAARLGS